MATMLTSSVSVDAEERGHMRVCLTHIYLLTWLFSACKHQVAKSSGRANVPVGTSLTWNQTLRQKQIHKTSYGR